MKPRDVANEIASLPAEARRQVLDFVAFLKSRAAAPRTKRGADRGPLGDEPFLGMWSDREDLRDGAAWVRRLRRHEWPDGRS